MGSVSGLVEFLVLVVAEHRLKLPQPSQRLQNSIDRLHALLCAFAEAVGDGVGGGAGFGEGRDFVRQG